MIVTFDAMETSWTNALSIGMDPAAERSDRKPAQNSALKPDRK
jgi:hypothetical protein